MGYTLEDAWQEEAYDRMVKEVLEAERDNVIAEYVAERLPAYFKAHPDIAVPAGDMLAEAQSLLTVSSSAALVFAHIAIEITLRDVLLKPVAVGLVHDEDFAPIVAEVIVMNNRFNDLLFAILYNFGVDLKTLKRQGKRKSLWEEMEDTKKVRHRIVHSGEKASPDEAQLAVKIARILLEKVYPHLRTQIGA